MRRKSARNVDGQTVHSRIDKRWEPVLHEHRSRWTQVLTAKHKPFRPFAICRNPHVQTVGAFLFRGKMSDYSAVKHVVRLVDGDRLVIHDDRPNSWITGDRIAILVPGLCGCHASPYMRRVSDKLRRSGVRTIRADMRGFGSSELISRSHVYAGCSQDIRSILEYVSQLSPISQISLIGFSLGGNIIMKTLGEWGPHYPRNVDSAVAVSPPIDLLHSSWSLRRNGNRFYDYYFAAQLRARLSFRRRKVKGLIDNGMNPLPDRLLHFDDRFTAPVWGYSGARDYYQNCSAGPLLKAVRVPSIIVTSDDDPIVPAEMYDNFEMSSQIEMVTTRAGGHLGFLGPNRGDPDRYWLDWRICRWIASLDDA